MDLPAIMKQLAPADIVEVHSHLVQRQGILFVITALDSTPPIIIVNEFIKWYTTNGSNPTWEALENMIRMIGAPEAAQKIRAIIPTTTPPASEQEPLKKKD